MQSAAPPLEGQDMQPLASLSLTHVYYDPSDPISLLCAYLALLPQALCIIYVTVILTSREAEVFLMFAGQMACEAVNFMLKRLIKEERPARIAATGKGYGMPSSHAQFVAFWAVACGLFLLVRHIPLQQQGGQQEVRVIDWEEKEKQHGGMEGRDQWQERIKQMETYARQPWSWLERAGIVLVAVVLASMVAWSRVYLGYHTPKQVLVGCLAGMISAVGWFAITAVVRQTGWLGWALDTPIARGLRVRDLVVSEDLSQAGWEKWEGLLERKRTRLKEKNR